MPAQVTVPESEDIGAFERLVFQAFGKCGDVSHCTHATMLPEGPRAGARGTVILIRL